MFGFLYLMVFLSCVSVYDFVRTCPANYYFNKDILVCKECSKCKEGEGLIKVCGKFSDAQCQECIEDYFSNNSMCVRCSRCPVGTKVERSCERTHDTVCVHLPTGPFKPSSETTIPSTSSTVPISTAVQSENGVELKLWLIPVLVVLAVLVLIALGLVQWLVRTKRKRRADTISMETSELEASTEQQSLIQPEFFDALKAQDLHMKNVTADLYEDLGHSLNPEGWRILAGRLGYTMEQATNFGLAKEKATQDTLKDWSTKKDSTLYVLAFHLLQMRRSDCLDKIGDYLKRLNRTTNV